MKTAFLKTEIGLYKIVGNEQGVYEVTSADEITHNDVPDELKQAHIELTEYFEGKRKEFTFNIIMEGTDFQKKVWNALINIPYGETRSYKDIAVEIGKPKASRAVGMANNKNKLPICIPCHRVIGSNNKLIGYAGGLHIKEFLLNLEQDK